ncbi:MAG: hypothetical protein ABIS03_09375, partial [Gemmatimonadaceae bacterium]
TTRRQPHPFVMALGIVTVLRFLGGIVILGVRALQPLAHPSSDETHAALGLAIPEALLIGIGLALLWLFGWRMPRALPLSERPGRIIALAVGVIAGGVLYIGVLGPRLLP